MSPRVGLALLLFVAARVSQAQAFDSRTAADSALSAGNIGLADSLYYAAVRIHPRDPAAREALGRYLGRTGRARIAVVLLEEARLFGGEPSRIASELAPLYESLGDWRALLTLQNSPLSQSERRRAAWLVEHPPSNEVDQSTQALVGPVRGDTLGRVATHVGARTAMAVVLAQDVGVFVGSHFAGRGTHTFPGGDSTVVALDSLRVGTAKFANVAARLIDSPGAVTIGMAGLGGLMPTFDYGHNTVSFNRPSVSSAVTRLPFIRDHGDCRVLDRGRWITLGDFAAAIAKARGTFTIDFHAGEVLVQP